MTENSTSVLIEDYRALLLIRRFEERVQELFSEGQIHGTCHLCIGQEAVPVGVCRVLAPGDQVVSCHRGHGHLLAMGGDPARLFGELMGKEIGYCRGRGGSQHISAPEIGFLGTNGITGGGIPIATGAGLSAQMKKTGGVVVCFFGDGATSQGAFHESVNMASLWRLPVIYVCENNGYAMSMPVTRSVAGGEVIERARAYAIRSERVDGMDVEAVSQATDRALAHARSGGGPCFIEAMTYRFCGHSKSDRLVYRTREEEAQWKARDPVHVMRERLEMLNLASEVRRVEREIEAKIAQAERSACDAAAAESATAHEGVYSRD